ncbi:MAG: molybdopterin converting factor subunit 1 [Chloroflexota bacterium]
MKVKVRFFAASREIVGKGQMELELPEGEAVSALLKRLESDFPALLTMPVMVAVNAEYVEKSHRLKSGDEVALIPPVSGG